MEPFNLEDMVINPASKDLEGGAWKETIDRQKVWKPAEAQPLPPKRGKDLLEDLDAMEGQPNTQSGLRNPRLGKKPFPGRSGR